MAIKINFDSANNPELPTLILATRNGTKIDGLTYRNIMFTGRFKSSSEMSFKIDKYINNQLNLLWDDVQNFRLVYCPEFDMWFEIYVEIDEEKEISKTVNAVQLGYAELGQTMLYDVQIRTEDDIARDDYVDAIFYNPDNPDGSILHRIMEKAPHYIIDHVDDSLVNEKRTFSFDDTSICDAFTQIEEELDCIFIINSNSDNNGKIMRSISVYDLEAKCLQCGYRGEFTDTCPECGSTNITNGYGHDTTIFVTSDELGENIKLQTNTDATKNCFKLEGGDDLFTATIRNCNPNGSDYIWMISDETKKDMSEELKNKLISYDNRYKAYQTEYTSTISPTILQRYNNLIDKYKQYNDTLVKIVDPITTYATLMSDYYETIDFNLYLQSEMMPNTTTITDTTAEQQATLLSTKTLSPVAVEKLSVVSLTTVNNAVQAMAKVLIDSRYQVKVTDNSSSYASQIWKGTFTITNYSDDEDTKTTGTISISINEDYETFTKQKIDKLLDKEISDVSIVGLFKMSENDFKNEIKKYCLDSLSSFYKSCQGCIDILVEQGISDPNNTKWGNNLYDDIYLPYYNKLIALSEEIQIRETEIYYITSKEDTDGKLVFNGMQSTLLTRIKSAQSNLDFQSYLGEILWLEFCSYRREDKYSNSNYTSDGLNNSELFERVKDFMNTAQKEIYKSAVLQHSITSTLKNLLIIKKFQPLVDHFSTGNWVRIKVDNDIYKLRLLSYGIDYDNVENINVEFSDVLKTIDGISDKKSVLDKAASMATSYSYVSRQAKQGSESNNQLTSWKNDGLTLTQMKITNDADFQNISWDTHGFLCREYNPITNKYNDEQLKIINSTISLTDDNWKTTKTALGKISYILDGVENEMYGLAAQAVISGVIISGNIYSNNYSSSNSIGTHINLNDGSFSFAGGKIAYNGGDRLYLKDVEINWNSSNAPQINNVTGLEDYLKELELKSRVIYSSTEPQDSESSYLTVNDVWIDTSNGNTMYRWNGSSWDKKLIGGSALTNISGNSITTGQISANRITMEGLSTKNGYFKVLSDGSIEATNGTFNGAMTGGSIVIGDKFNVDEEGCATVSGLIISEKSEYNNSQNINLHPAGLRIHTEMSQNQTYTDYGTIVLNAFYADTSIKMYNNATKEENDDYSICINSTGSISCKYLESSGAITADDSITGTDYVKVIGDGKIVGQLFRLYDSNNIEKTAMSVFDGDINGIGVRIGAGGATVIGGGESSSNYITKNSINGATENLYLTSDNHVYLATNCNAIDEQKILIFNANGNIYPAVTKDFNVGHTSYRFNYGYFNSVYNASGVITSSDRRLKDNFAEIPNPVEFILSLKPQQFTYNHGDSGRNHWGFIAQDVKESLDAICKSDCGLYVEEVKNDDPNAAPIALSECDEDNKILALRYEELIAPLVVTVQRQQQSIEILKQEIENLKQGVGA